MRPSSLVVFALFLTGCGGCQPGSSACYGDAVLCDGGCADLSEDPSNCGSCGATCGSSTYCDRGSCLACLAPNTVCRSSCVDLLVDVEHCGACGRACALGECRAGVCRCPAPLGECNGKCVDLSTEANCGQCGRRCSAAERCSGGSCFPRCSTGLTLCDNDCVNVKDDRSNCGRCGRVCAVNQVCRNGSCTD